MNVLLLLLLLLLLLCGWMDACVPAPPARQCVSILCASFQLDGLPADADAQRSSFLPANMPFRFVIMSSSVSHPSDKIIAVSAKGIRARLSVVGVRRLD